jgi:zinc protease
VTTITTRPVPPLGRPRPGPPLPIARDELDTGLKVVAIEHRGVPLVQLRLWVPFAGSDEAEAARSSLLATTMVAGTEHLEDAGLAAALQHMGGTLSVGADPDRLLIRGEALATRLPDLLELLADVLTSATYPEHEVEGERERIVEELKLAWSYPTVLGQYALLRRIFGSHPYTQEIPEAEPIVGTSVAYLRRLHAERVLPQGSTLVLVGDVPADQAVALADSALSRWNRLGTTPRVPALPEIEPGPTVLVNRPGSVQSSIWVGGYGLPRSDPSYPALQVANIVFGGNFASRLVRNLREDKGYTYVPESAFLHFATGSILQLHVDVANDVTAPAILEIAYEVGRMATLLVARDELEHARDYAIGALALQTATQAGLVDEVVELETSGLEAEWLQELPRRLAEVTAEQVLEQAARFFAPSRMVTVIVGDAEQIAGPVSRLQEIDER